MTIGLALPSWIWLIAPYIHDHAVDGRPTRLGRVSARPTSCCSAVAVRLALDGGQRAAGVPPA